MSKAFFIFLFLAVSVTSLAQTRKILNHNVLNIDSFKELKIPVSNYTFKNKILLSPNYIYHDSLYIKNSRFNPLYNSENVTLLMSNKYYYYNNNPLAPHGNCFSCAIVLGSLNYLFLLIDKSN